MLSGKEQLDKNWRSLKIVFQLGLQDTKLSYIIITKYYRFCFGVKRAMKMAWDELEGSQNTIYALGPLIHNKQAVSKYEERGLQTVDTIENIPLNNKMIIRSHGVSEKIYNDAKEKDLDNALNIYDMTYKTKIREKE